MGHHTGGMETPSTEIKDRASIRVYNISVSMGHVKAEGVS